MRTIEGQLKEAQRVARIGSWYWDTATDALWWSDQLYVIYGRDPKSPVSSYDQNNYTPESAERLTAAVQKILQTGEPYEIDLELNANAGPCRWVMARGEAERNANGEIIGLQGTVQDITERKLMTEALCISERNLRESQEVGRIGSYEFNIQKDLWTSSSVMDEIFGIGVDYPRTLADWTQILHPAERGPINSYFHEIVAEHRTFEKEYRIVRVNDGMERWVLGIGRVEYDSNGLASRMVGIIQDITERKQSEEELKKYAQRLIALEENLRKRIAMELHDDIGQVLTALGLNLAHIGNRLKHEAGDDLRTVISDSRMLTKEISRSVRGLMVELRPTQLDEYGLAAAIRSHGEQFALRTGISVDVVDDAEFPRLSAKKEIALFRISQEALNNVSKHAGATRVVVCVRCVGSSLLLSIVDDGRGFAPQTAPPMWADSGWGLTLMRERAKLIGGSFEVKSVPGQGTTIEVGIKAPRSGLK